jgi:acetyl esterase
VWVRVYGGSDTGTAAQGGAFEAIFANFKPPKIEIERSEETIKGAGGQDMTLFIHKPKGASGALPCIYHTHGGGMALGHAKDATYMYQRDAMAAEGLIVVGVEFRNCGGADGLNPFPAGLDDCSAGLVWTAANKGKLGISKIIVAGESGGGNLSIATTMANKGLVDGTYSMCPYIAGDRHYENPPAELKSLVENDGIFIGLDMFVPLGLIYVSTASHSFPVSGAWPSSAETMTGLPVLLPPPCFAPCNSLTDFACRPTATTLPTLWHGRTVRAPTTTHRTLLA